MNIESIINYILLIILIWINVKEIYKILSCQISSLHPYSIFVLTVATQMFPQLLTIFIHDYYSKDIIPNLLFVMISCQLAFKYGIKIAYKQKIPSRVMDFSKRRMGYVLILFTIIGLIPMLFYGSMKSVYGGINVVLGIYRNFGFIALIISLVYIKRNLHYSLPFLYTIILLSFIPLIYYGIAVKGSRATLFSLAYIFFTFITIYYKRYQKLISITFFIIFFIGIYFSSSITEIREKRIYRKNAEIEINFWEKFKKSIISHDPTIHGMDLGNGAILIDYTAKNKTYDYGTIIWNGFVYNYVPERFVGKGIKDKVKINIFEDANNSKLEKDLLDGITTTTGYYNAFQAFSYFGFVIFFFTGYLLGRFMLKSKISTFYLLAFIFTSIMIPNMITHGIQYIFGNMELLFIFIMPFFIFSLTTLIKKRRIYIKNTYNYD